LLPELLNVNPRYVILQIGRNDISLGISAATWQANYANIVNTLNAAGVTVYHQLPLPEVTLNQAALTTYIHANYSNVLTVPGTWNTGTDLAADNIHPNASGNSKVAFIGHYTLNIKKSLRQGVTVLQSA
jgi:lysophospholipase L1-like esterase